MKYHVLNYKSCTEGSEMLAIREATTRRIIYDGDPGQPFDVRQLNKSAYEDINSLTSSGRRYDLDQDELDHYDPNTSSRGLRVRERRSDVEQPPRSGVYLMSGKGKRYQLSFRAKDPEFTFLRVHPRKSPDNTMHKGSQACSTNYFVEVRDARCQKYVTRMKRYKIAECKPHTDS
ncbi:unnamed protein product [Dicrocoelium dendriticum]|nr:unnamed protein product [Dicrocoelium dendriticum]